MSVFVFEQVLFSYYISVIEYLQLRSVINNENTLHETLGIVIYIGGAP